MNLAYSHFETANNGTTLIKQDTDMSEQARGDFLSQFSRERENTLVGFAVLGGIFAEAIDLMGNQLCCAVIVGVGLPGISLERKLIQNYFEESIGQGYDYAFLFPGVIRVFQAAGRVIRSETDRGVIVFIDERYTQHRYGRLFPPEWQTAVVADEAQMERSLTEFWQEAPGSS